MARNIHPFAINTYSYTMSHSAADCVTHLIDAGYSDFELMMYPGHLWPADMDPAARSGLRQHIEARGARVITLNMPNVDLNLAGAAEEMRAYTLGLLRGVVGLAGDLGVPGVVLGIGKANPLFPAPTERLVGYFYQALDELLPLAEKAGTELWVENMPFSFISDVDTLMNMLDQYGGDDVGFVYDVANGHFIGEDLSDGLRRVKDRLKLVHLSDTTQRIYRHDPVGAGDLDFAPLPATLREVGYQELAMLEIVSLEPDREIRESADHLFAAGYPHRDV